MSIEWIKHEQGERAIIGHLAIDVRIDTQSSDNSARYTVIHITTGKPLAGGKCLDLDWAKKVGIGFACSINDIIKQE